MNAANEARLRAAEAKAIEQMSDEQLEAIVDQTPWLRECTDDELQQMFNGGPCPARFAHLAGAGD